MSDRHHFLLRNLPFPQQLAFLQGTGTAEEMAISERATMVTEGIVIASVDVERSLPPSPAAAAQEAARPGGLRARVRVTTRAMWTNRGQLLEDLHKVGTRVLCSGAAGCDLRCACGWPGACVPKCGRPLVLFNLGGTAGGPQHLDA